MPKPDLPLVARDIRKNIISSLAIAGSGHTAGAMGTADIFAWWYFGGGLRHRSGEPSWEGRDRLILSCGHYAPVLYVTLAMAGYFPLAELSSLRKIGSRLQGHPVKRVELKKMSGLGHEILPGVENTSGPLGQGVSVAVGMALAAKRRGEKHWVWCLGSDGEVQEGQTWEAYISAVKYELGNLIYVIDYNNIQITGEVSKIMPLGNLKKRLEGCGMEVMEIDGHDFEDLEKVKEWAGLHPKTPKAVIMVTTPGKGVGFMENNYRWHGIPPTKEQAFDALEELIRGKK